MDKHKTGLISQLIAEKWIIEKGFIVCRPITDNQEYDMIIDDNGKLYKIQVKTIYWDNSKNRFICSLVTSHRRGNQKIRNKKYTKKSFDFLLAVNAEFGAIYKIPIAKVAGKRSMTFYPKGMLKSHKHSRFKNYEEYRVDSS